MLTHAHTLNMCACPLRNVWVLSHSLTLRPMAHVTQIPLIGTHM